MAQELEQASKTGEPSISPPASAGVTWRRRILRWLFLFVLVPYLVILLAFVAFQRSLIYPGTRRANISVADALLPLGQVQDVTVDTDGGLPLHGWHVLADGQTAANREESDRRLADARWVVLAFPGNGGCRVDRGTELRDFAELRMHAFLFDYRGYGDNSGSCSESAFAADGHSIWKYATQTRGVPGDRIIVFGESLGGGVAVRLAADLCEAKTPPAALVLSSTFTSLTDTAAWHYPYLPVRMMLLDRYNSAACMPKVTCPVVMLHGAEDEIVPLEIGRRLFAAAPSRSSNGIEKSFVEVPYAMHNAIPRDTLKKSLRTLTRAIAAQRRSL